ncbi:MAG TPA: hypothetical protein VGP26_30375 [Actinophytocola sp.]|jgi:hypothetical protein|nr:hypothetical protein [Actinophytocola sp.]
MNTTRVLIVGLLTAGGLLSACSGQEQAATEDTPATTTASAPSTSASEGQPESPETTSGAADGGSGEATGIAPGEPDPNGGGGANCGDVKTANGKADVFAEDTPAGTVGCVEAINVITKYIAQSPTKGEGTAYSLTVDGWSCLTDTGAQGSGLIGCDKDGLAFHTQS